MKTPFPRETSPADAMKPLRGTLRTDCLSLALLSAVALTGCAGADSRPARASAKSDRLSAQAAQAGAHYTRYVALGDSFVSGDGISGNKGTCHLSDQAWPNLLNESLAAGGAKPMVQVAACSGATTNEILKDYKEKGQKPQMQAVKGADANTLVTITIGGNDAQTSKEVLRCLASNCEKRRDTLKTRIQGTVARKLKSTFAALRKAAPNATIVATGYPMLVSANAATAPGCKDVFTNGEVQMIRDSIGLMNAEIKAAAEPNGIKVVIDEVVKAFDGKEACSGAGALINEANKDLGTTLHPNLAGNTAFAHAMEAGLARIGISANRTVDTASDNAVPPKDTTGLEPSAANAPSASNAPSAQAEDGDPPGDELGDTDEEEETDGEPADSDEDEDEDGDLSGDELDDTDEEEDDADSDEDGDLSGDELDDTDEDEEEESADSDENEDSDLSGDVDDTDEDEEEESADADSDEDEDSDLSGDVDDTDEEEEETDGESDSED